MYDHLRFLGRTRNQGREICENPVFWIGDIQLWDITAVCLYYNLFERHCAEITSMRTSRCIDLSFVFILLLYFHHLIRSSFLVFPSCWRELVLPTQYHDFLPHDDAIRSYAVRVDSATYNGAHFARFLLVGFYAHRQSSLFSSHLSFSLSISLSLSLSSP